MKLLAGFIAAALVASVLGIAAQDAPKRLSPEHVKLAESLKDERDAIQVENLKLQAHVADYNVRFAEALALFRKDLGGKSTDAFDLDSLSFHASVAAVPTPSRGTAPGR